MLISHGSARIKAERTQNERSVSWELVYFVVLNERQQNNTPQSTATDKLWCISDSLSLANAAKADDLLTFFLLSFSFINRDLVLSLIVIY